MNSAFSITLLLAIFFLPEKNECYVLPVDESKCRRIIEWGEEKTLPDLITPIGHHDNMIFLIPNKSELKSYSNGVVISTAIDHSKFGKTIKIRHDSNIISFYGHLDTAYVVAGQKVACGELIGRTGSSGKTAGPNLYLKVLEDSVSVDPRERIKEAHNNR